VAATLHIASFAELDTATLYALLRLRVDVFVVEQQCPYPELDGRDAEPSTLHFWLAGGDGRGVSEPVAYLRLLSEPDGTARIGRVVVARQARGTGLAGRLMAEALARIGERECVLDAQTPLVGFYTGLGFTATGPEFLEDGIAHVPMRRGVYSRRPM
jgi:ElaA protein